MFSHIKLILIAIIILALLGAGWYVTNLKADLAVSQMNNEKLKEGIKEQQALIEQIQKDVQHIQDINRDLMQQNEKAKEDVKTLTNKFNKKNFGALAAQKPELVEKLVNRGTENAIRCLELASGAPLNEKEKAAKTPSEANRECPSLVNPAFTAPN